jgi:hypothetical protein
MVAIIDDLIILGVAIAASVAASQVSAHSQESAATDEAGRQREAAKKQQEMDFWINRAAQYGNQGVAGMKAQRDRGMIEQGYEGMLRAASQQADQTRLNGYLQAGSMLAGGIANTGMSAASGAAGGGGLSNALGGNDSLAERAGSMALDEGAYGLLAGSRLNDAQPPIRGSDPSGGFKLQEQDYRLLGGAGDYAQSPYNDDPYATGVGFANPNRFRFSL